MKRIFLLTIPCMLASFLYFCAQDNNSRNPGNSAQVPSTDASELELDGFHTDIRDSCHAKSPPHFHYQGGKYSLINGTPLSDSKAPALKSADWKRILRCPDALMKMQNALSTLEKNGIRSSLRPLLAASTQMGKRAAGFLAGKLAFALLSIPAAAACEILFNPGTCHAAEIPSIVQIEEAAMAYAWQVVIYKDQLADLQCLRRRIIKNRIQLSTTYLTRINKVNDDIAIISDALNKVNDKFPYGCDIKNPKFQSDPTVATANALLGINATADDFCDANGVPLEPDPTVDNLKLSTTTTTKSVASGSQSTTTQTCQVTGTYCMCGEPFCECSGVDVSLDDDNCAEYLKCGSTTTFSTNTTKTTSNSTSTTKTFAKTTFTTVTTK